MYQGQSGALNESLSDVFGALTEQHHLGPDAPTTASWLIGEGIFTAAVQGDALRSLKAPGTAYDDDVLGRDPQPAHMDDYVETTRRQRRRAHQLRHPESRVLPDGAAPRRQRVGARRPDLVPHAHRGHADARPPTSRAFARGHPRRRRGGVR